MPVFTEYAAPFLNGGFDTCIGPDGNLWIVDGTTGNVYRFNVTTFVTTTFNLPNALELVSISTDGTYLYVTDFNSASATGNVAIYQVTTAGVASPFFVVAGGNSGSTYFDGTYLWFTDRFSAGGGFRQFTVPGGTIVNDYPTTINKGGGLLNDGTYWWSGEIHNGTGNGISYAPVASPGTWTNVVSPNGTPTFVSALSGGFTWWGDGSADFYSIEDGVFSIVTHSPTPFAGGASGQLCTTNGTDLWATNSAPLSGGIWQTTAANPLVGIYYALGPGNAGADTLIYDAATQTLWATGNDTGGNNYVYSLSLANPGDPIRMLL